MADNPNAFPACNEANVDNTMGMTLRDWFAGQALAQAFDYACNRPESLIGRDYLPEEWAAKMAYALADAMLAERNKAGPEKEMQHVAYYDEGQFHWMSGIAPRDCELFAARAAIAAATGEAK